MRRSLAVLFDAVVIAVAGYVLFRVAEALSPCNSAGQCPLLAPLVVLFLLLLLALYFGLGFLRFQRTPGERIFRH